VKRNPPSDDATLAPYATHSSAPRVGQFPCNREITANFLTQLSNYPMYINQLPEIITQITGKFFALNRELFCANREITAKGV
jgi:hypothetical protein